MPTVKVYNMAGEAVGEVELSEAIFGIEPNKQVLHETALNYLSNQRQGTQSALTRAEVSGGGKKPYRQKGTGRARQGSTRAPHYVHGGIAFAPKPRSYAYTLNKKMKRLALKSALSVKAAEDAVVVIDNLEMAEIKTATFKKFLTAVGVDGKAMVVTDGVNKNVVLSARNIAGVQTTIATILNPYELMTSGKLVLDKAALAKIEEVYA